MPRNRDLGWYAHRKWVVAGGKTEPVRRKLVRGSSNSAATLFGIVSVPFVHAAERQAMSRLPARLPVRFAICRSASLITRIKLPTA